MRIVLAFLSGSVWLVALLSGMYCGVSADVSTDGWIGMFFLLTLSLAMFCAGVTLQLWAPHYERLRTPGWLMLGCSILFWMGDGLVAGVLMVLPCVVYAGWAVWRSFTDFMARPPTPPSTER